MKKYLLLVVALFALSACGKSKQATEQSITLESKETTLTSKEKVLESRAKTLESKESELTEQSKTVESKEKALEEREKGVATKESEQNATEEYVEENSGSVNEQATEVPHDYNPPTDEEAAEMERKYEEDSNSKIKKSTVENGAYGTTEYNENYNEIITYYTAKKAETIDKKRQQVNDWKANGEVNWSDEVISEGLIEMENSFYSGDDYAIYVESQSVNEIKARIDNDADYIFNSHFQKGY